MNAMNLFAKKPKKPTGPVPTFADAIVAASNSLAKNPAFYCLTQPTATVILTYAITKSGDIEIAPKIGSFLGSPIGPDVKGTLTKATTQAMKLTLTAPPVPHEVCPEF